MGLKVLVAYASRHGSTREVAEEIGTTIEGDDARVDLMQAEEVGSLQGYDLVIVGGALYTGRWHKDAISLIQRQHDALAQIPFAVYAMGPRTLEDADVAASRHQLDVALAKLPVEPFAVTVFGGVVDPAKLHFPLSRMPAVDARDHTAIQAWAHEVLAASAAAASVR